MAYSFGPGMEARGWKKTLYIDLVTPSAVIFQRSLVPINSRFVFGLGLVLLIEPRM